MKLNSIFSGLILAALILAAILLMIFFRGCSGSSATKVNKTDTVFRKPDTTLITIKFEGQPSVPVPIKITPFNASSGTSYNQPVTIDTAITNQFRSMQARITYLEGVLYAQNTFADTTKLRDSSGAEIGYFKHNDIVSGNSLIRNAPTYSVQQKIISNTQTITIDHPYQERNQLYVGGGFLGDQSGLLKAFKAGVLLKNKKGMVIELNGTRGQYYWGGEVGIYKLISFRKK